MSDCKKYPTKLSITGIDGSGKDSITHEVLGALAEEQGLLAAKLGRPSLMFAQDGYYPLYRRVTNVYNSLHLLAESKKWPHATTAVNGLYVLVQARKLEPRLLEKDVDILTTVRDCRVDPAVHIDFYQPFMAKRGPSLEERIAIMQRLTGVSRDAVLWLNTDPRIAIERVRSNIALAQNAGIRGTGDMHETQETLSALSQVYRPALKALQAHAPTAIIEIDNSERAFNQTVEVVKETVARIRAKDFEPGEWVHV